VPQLLRARSMTIRRPKGLPGSMSPLQDLSATIPAAARVPHAAVQPQRLGLSLPGWYPRRCRRAMLLLETTRGCVFKCKFCYYPKATTAV